jgi:hypothetical protein
VRNELKQSSLEIHFQAAVCRLHVGGLYETLQRGRRRADDEDPKSAGISLIRLVAKSIAAHVTCATSLSAVQDVQHL